MEDLSLHILDLMQNSITAKEDLVKVSIDEDEDQDILKIEIEDNGRGMDDGTIERVVDPFYTTRTTRRVGLGIPLLKATAEACGGGMKIKSKPGEGTGIRIWLQQSHIDRPPIGNMADTMVTSILCNPGVDFIYKHKTHLGEFTLDTREIRRAIGRVPIDNMEVVTWIQTNIVEGLKEIHGGAI